jgi:diguanylate cyclase (GGDEF)-like protein/PAS domain S-box-containing protein
MSTSVDLALVDRYPEGWSGEVLEFVCAFDLEGEIIAANEGMARLTGYSRDQLLRTNIRDLVDDKSWDPLNEHATQIRILKRNGRVATLAISRTWLSENGTPVALEITGHSKSTARSNQLHRLSKTNYDSLEHAFDDYLKTGCRLFGLAAGMVLQFAGSAATLLASHGATGLATKLPIASTPCATQSARLRTVTRSAPSDGTVHAAFETYIGTPIVADLMESLAKGLGSVVSQDGNKVPDISADTVLAEVVRMVESQRPGARCSVVKWNGDGSNEAATSVPISSANGISLGHLVLEYREKPTDCERDEQLLHSAARIAGIAIEQRLTAERLEFQARHDSLTGLPNRVYFTTLLESALTDTSRSGVLAVLFIDLDRFKQINDTLGHAMGDLLIAEVGHRLRRLLSEGDLAGRMGGDEFTIALLRQPDEQTAIQSARECLNVLRAPHRIDDHELFVTASIGVALCPSHGVSAADLLRNADHAMYGAKKSGKNDIEVFTDTQVSGLQRFRLENALRRALDRNEFDLLYQPLVNVNGRIEGLEALLTWKHPVYGTIGPKQFIPIAEETGLIIPIGSWVIREACLQGAQWKKSGYRCVRISVNVSTLQFERRDFVETVAAALAFSGLPADCLELELTESYVMRDLPGAAYRLSQIRDLGVSISIDDFGTGYSSLSYLNKLPLDSLKIDQSFLRNLQEPDGSLPVVQSIVRLAHSMNLTVVAEGVETIEELELVRLLGCDKVQGHLYGRSLNTAEAEALLARPDGMAQIAGGL